MSNADTVEDCNISPNLVALATTSALNRPPFVASNLSCFLMTFNSSSQHAVQLCGDWLNRRLGIRLKNGGIWSDWKEIVLTTP